MSKPSERKAVQKSANTKAMISSLVGMQITDEIAANLLLNQMTEYQCSPYILLNCDEKQYVWNEKEKKATRIHRAKTLTEAKQILIKKEQEAVSVTDEAV